MRRFILFGLCLCLGCGDSSRSNNSSNPVSQNNKVDDSPEQHECGQFLDRSSDGELTSIVTSVVVVVENNEPDPYADLFECPHDVDCSSPPPYISKSDQCGGVVLNPNWVLVRAACLPSKPVFRGKMSLSSRRFNHLSQFELIEKDEFALIHLLEPITYRGYFFGARLMKSRPADGLSISTVHRVNQSGRYQRTDKLQYQAQDIIRPNRQMTCEHDSSIAAFDTVAESPVVIGLASPSSNQYQLVSPVLDWVVQTLAAHDVTCSTHQMMYNPEVEYIQCF